MGVCGEDGEAGLVEVCKAGRSGRGQEEEGRREDWRTRTKRHRPLWALPRTPDVIPTCARREHTRNIPTSDGRSSTQAALSAAPPRSALPHRPITHEARDTSERALLTLVRAEGSRTAGVSVVIASGKVRCIPCDVRQANKQPNTIMAPCSDLLLCALPSLHLAHILVPCPKARTLCTAGVRYTRAIYPERSSSAAAPPLFARPREQRPLSKQKATVQPRSALPHRHTITSQSKPLTRTSP